MCDVRHVVIIHRTSHIKTIYLLPMPNILIIKSDKRPSYLPEIIREISSEKKLSIFSSDKAFLEAVKIENVKTHYRRGIEEPRTFGDFFFFTLFSPLLWAYGLYRLINFKVRKSQVLILTSLTEKILLTPWAKLLKYKIIWLEEDYLYHNFKINIYSIFYRWFSRFTSLVAASQAIKDSLITDLKIPESRITVIAPGLNIEELTSQATIYEDLADKDYQIKNAALFIIGFVGELIPENGLEYLIKAIDNFRELIPDFQVIVVGDGEQKKNLLWLTKMTHLEQRVRLVGLQKNIHRWYKHFDILVLPRTKKTTFSITVAQAMAVGLPVIASDLPGLSEVVNNQGGILVPSENPEALAKAIFELYHNKDLRIKFSQQAQARIRTHYSKEVMVKKWREILVGS